MIRMRREMWRIRIRRGISWEIESRHKGLRRWYNNRMINFRRGRVLGMSRNELKRINGSRRRWLYQECIDLINS
jgi:hypothetical protein